MTLLPQSCIRVTKSGIPSRMAIAVRPSSGTTNATTAVTASSTARMDRVRATGALNFSNRTFPVFLLGRNSSFSKPRMGTLRT